MIIKSPSRLHMTLIDLNGSYARIDGGMGLTIEDPNFILYGETSEKGVQVDFSDELNDTDIISEYEKKITDAANCLIDHLDLEDGFYFNVKKGSLPHSGLGFGTQTSLSTAKLITELVGETVDTHQLAHVVKRGGTSGVGIHAFEKGGFIIDGGHNLKEKNSFLPSSASNANPPLLISRYDFPEEWGVLIVILNSKDSVCGNKEVNIFQNYCPVPKNEVCEVSHLILMNLIPSLIEKDLPTFGHTIDEIQNKGFKKIEVSLQSDKIMNLIAKMREVGAYGVGMSSFGPTIYSIFDKNNKHIVEEIREYVGSDGVVFTTKAQNSGHEIIK